MLTCQRGRGTERERERERGDTKSERRKERRTTESNNKKIEGERCVGAWVYAYMCQAAGKFPGAPSVRGRLLSDSCAGTSHASAFGVPLHEQRPKPGLNLSSTKLVAKVDPGPSGATRPSSRTF